MSDSLSNTTPTILEGGCKCGLITYHFPLPPAIDVEGPDVSVSKRYKTNLIPPSKQKFPTRGNRPNQNKWRGNHCHCNSCRRSVGALMIDWVTQDSNDLVIVRKGSVGKYKSSSNITREFCTTCGTSLFFFNENDPESVDVTIGSIVTPNLSDFLEFTDHLWVEDAINLVLDEEGKGGGLAGVLNDGLPKFMGNRSSQNF